MKFLVFLAVVLWPFSASAETIKVTVGELNSALLSADNAADSIRSMVYERIRHELAESGIGVQPDSLLFQERYSDEVVEGGCNNTVIQHLDLGIVVKNNTEFSFTLKSLHDPISVSARLEADINAQGRAKQEFGIRLGSCQELASDSFEVAANGEMALDLTATLTLNPTWPSPSTLQLQPKLVISGDLLSTSIRVDVDDSVFRKLLESFLQDEVDAKFGVSAFNQQIANLQQQTDQQIADAFTDGGLTLALPAAEDAQVIALYRQLQPDARFPHSLAYLQNNWYEILGAIIVDDQQTLATILEGSVACEAGNLLQTTMPAHSLFSMASGACSVAEPIDSGRYFSDGDCQSQLRYEQTSLADFCNVALDKNRLGNAASYPKSLSAWTRSPGTAFDIAALPLSGSQPYSRRERYKTVDTDAGQCQLEMRIYDQTPGSSRDKPVLIAWHGGSWQNRGSGFLGVETMATHFTNAGFVVFAPFYRLIGDKDGNPECHNASFEQVLEDTNDAFDWVVNNADTFGGAGKPIVFGQSAGGHLAASMAVHRWAEVDRAILFYAPLDFQDFAEQLIANPGANPAGQRIFESLSGSSLENVDLTSALIQSNRFPAIVSEAPELYPPMFMLHGEMDSLLPYRQSVLMCNALMGGNASNVMSIGVSLTGYKREIRCGDNDSQLHLIAEGEHTLDLCIAPGLCFSGSEQSAAATKESMQQMLRFATARVSLDQASGGGGGSSTWIACLMLPLIWFRRSRSSSVLPISWTLRVWTKGLLLIGFMQS